MDVSLSELRELVMDREAWRAVNFMSCCGKLFRKSVLDEYKIRLQPDLITFEDFDFVLHYLENINSLVVTDSYSYSVFSEKTDAPHYLRVGSLVLNHIDYLADERVVVHVVGDTTTCPSVQFSSVAQSCLTLCNPMNRSTPGLPVHHQLPEFTQTHVHRVSDAIQPSHPLSSPSPPAPNPSQHQSLFQ